MATSLTGSFNVSADWTYLNVLTAGNVRDANRMAKSIAFTDGVGVNQCNRMYKESGTIAASGSTTITLSSVTNSFGTSIAFARIKSLYFELQTTTTASSVLLGAAGTNPWVAMLAGTTPQIRVLNGGVLFMGIGTAAGYVVTASSSDQLKITNADASNTATWRMVLMGGAT